jgi:glycosyltransferase involved in cell wall biosynthesis
MRFDGLRTLVLLPALPDLRGNGLVQRTGVFVEAACSLGEVHCAVFPVYGPCEAESSLTARLHVPVAVIHDAGTIACLAAMRAPEGPAPRLADPEDPSIRRLLAGQAYDVVYVARLCLMPLMPAVMRQRGSAQIVVDLDEDEGAVARRIARLRRARGDRDAAATEIRKAAAGDALLAATLRDIPVVSVSSSRERALVAGRFGHPNVVVIPNAAPDVAAMPAADDRTDVVFAGNFAYVPNFDAAGWLIGDIWPRIRRAVPRARLVLAGQGSVELAAIAAGARDELQVECIANPDDILVAYANAAVAVVPLRAGGGTRIKILEAASLSIPLVSTTVGVEGLDLLDGRHLLVADDALSFACACIEVLRSPDAARTRAMAAREAVLPRHARQRIMAQVRTLLTANAG